MNADALLIADALCVMVPRLSYIAYQQVCVCRARVQGNRWQSAPDGIKGHDFSYWGPFTFDPEGTPSTVTFQDTYQLDVAVGPS